MATDAASTREATPTALAIPSSIPQKRVYDDHHSPAVSSPLNPEVKPSPKSQAQGPTPDDTQTAMSKEKRPKKESAKKRGDPKGIDSSRATPDPKPRVPPEELVPQRYKFPPPKPSDFEQPRGPVFTSHHRVQDATGRTIDFFEASDHVHNKKSYQYVHCIADPAFPSMLYYRQTEPAPYGAHMNFEDAAGHILFDREGAHVTTDKGFRMSRANVAVREGRWYWECKVTQGILRDRKPDDPEAHGHVRVGWARREASLDAPVGFDAYSYGIRDKEGQKVHMSRPAAFFPEGEDVVEGDVLGLEIRLPSQRLHRKIVLGQYNPVVDGPGDDDDNPVPGFAHDDGLQAVNIVRDRIPIRFKTHMYLEKINYQATKELDDMMNPSSGSGSSLEKPSPTHPVPACRTLPGSQISVYKNGVLMGTPWTDLLAFLPPASKLPPQQPPGREELDDGSLGYYPAVSVFRGGAVEVNFGPNFWFPPPGYGDDEDVVMEGAEPEVPTPRAPKLRPLSERYEEQIVEDIVYDVVDEATFWVLDGCRVVDRFGKDEKAGGTMGGREEIKELVQDD